MQADWDPASKLRLCLGIYDGNLDHSALYLQAIYKNGSPRTVLWSLLYQKFTAIPGRLNLDTIVHVSDANPVLVDGDFRATGTITALSCCSPSDSRLKKNVCPIENALDLVSQLQGNRFDWDRERNPERGLSQGRQMGVIAQEVEQVAPELVATSVDGYKAVNYSKLSVVLLEAMKEQQTMIEAQGQHIESLQKQIDSLTNK